MSLPLLTCLHCNAPIRPRTGVVPILGESPEQKQANLFERAMEHLAARHPEEMGAMQVMLSQFSGVELFCHFSTKDEVMKKDVQIAAAMVERHVGRVLTDEDIQVQLDKVKREAGDLAKYWAVVTFEDAFSLMKQQRDYLHYVDVLPFQQNNQPGLPVNPNGKPGGSQGTGQGGDAA